MLAAVKKNWRAQIYASDKLKKDSEIKLKVKNNKEVEDKIDEIDKKIMELRKSKKYKNFDIDKMINNSHLDQDALTEFKKAIDGSKKNLYKDTLKYGSDELKKDFDFMLNTIKQATNQNINVKEYVSEEIKKDPKFVNIIKNLENIKVKTLVD
jgi:hypothetical protein